MKAFSYDEFSDSCIKATHRLFEDLPAEISQKLRKSRRAIRHGTEARFYQYLIWHKLQAGTLEKNHFNCSIIYDGPCRYHREWKAKGLPHQLFCRFYANKIRIYNQGELIKAHLRSRLKDIEKQLSGWYYDEHEQMLSLMYPFEAASNEELGNIIYNVFMDFMPQWIDAYSYACAAYISDLNENKVQAFKAERGHSGYVPARSDVDLTRYSRSIPPALRQRVLSRDNKLCLKCGSTIDLHVDHIVPVSLGGLTEFNNLQTLCSICNLSKGNRNSYAY